jgi:signal peptidase I
MSQWSANEHEAAIDETVHTERKSVKRQTELWEWMKSIGMALIIVILIHLFIFNLSTVKGTSMQPTLQDGEWLFINKIGYIIGAPDRGDIVILKDPEEQLGFRQYLVKRIVGLPGDTVEVINQKLYVNGVANEEPYTDVPIMDGDYGPEVVPEDHYFVMGDNRREYASTDSRVFHSVPEKLIKGKAQLILWPLDQMGGLYDTLPEESN